MARVGIVTGSGPEAGLDLWSKLLSETRSLVGAAFRGDLDAPHVVIVSDPLLGLSMELERNLHLVWPRLAEVATALSGQVDVFAIACNTLNLFQPQLDEMRLPARLVAFADVLLDQLSQEGVEDVALLGAAPVIELGPRSHYAPLAKRLRLEEIDAGTRADLHAIIYDVKTAGGSTHAIEERFERVLQRLRSEVVVLACTELPLIRARANGRRLLDVSRLVARRLASIAWNELARGPAREQAR